MTFTDLKIFITLTQTQNFAKTAALHHMSPSTLSRQVQKIEEELGQQLRAAFAEAKTVKGKPTAIIARTVKGKGVSFMENNAGWHGKAPNQEQFEAAMAELDVVSTAVAYPRGRA